MRVSEAELNPAEEFPLHDMFDEAQGVERGARRASLDGRADAPQACRQLQHREL